MSNALCNILLSISRADGAGNLPSTLAVSSAAAIFSTTLLLVGAVVLVGWLLSQLQRNGKYKLKNVPLRRNNIHPASLVLVFVGWQLCTISAIWVFMRFGMAELYAGLGGGMIGQIVAIPAALIFAHISFRRGIKRGLGFTLRHPLYDTARGVVGFLAVFPVCIMLGIIVTWICDKFLIGYTPHEYLQALPKISVEWKVVVFISTAILAPVVEEIFFRGLLQSALRRIVSPWVAIGIASVIFAAVHTSQWQYMPALFVLAVALGYNYERCGRLWPSILMHALFNSATLITQFLM
ncbi:MAG: CPBP family intramembrane metalloprotease [Phycisphaerae bacterium]|nr:CPBP family intramembrane metalloprotease [Phycisphaerae bacterium]